MLLWEIVLRLFLRLFEGCYEVVLRLFEGCFEGVCFECCFEVERLFEVVLRLF